jgi:hypothetical protein
MAFTRQRPSWTLLFDTDFLISGVIFTKALRVLTLNSKYSVRDFTNLMDYSNIKIQEQAQNSRSSSSIIGIKTSLPAQQDLSQY